MERRSEDLPRPSPSRGIHRCKQIAAARGLAFVLALIAPSFIGTALMADKATAAQSNPGATPAGHQLAPDPGSPRQYSDATAKLAVYHHR
jgi:hypothetical protein